MLASALAALLAVACGDGEPSPPAGEDTPPADAGADRGALEAVHERSLTFLSRDPDATVVVPWIFRAELREGMDVRERDVWLGGEGGWERLAAESDSMRERIPARSILPGRRVRIVVGPDGALEVLALRDPARPLELTLGIALAQWAGPGDESVRFQRATASLPGGEVEGYVLDLTSERDGTDPARDWIFLQGGDALQAAFVEEGLGPDARERSRYRAWTRWAVRENYWPGVIVEWAETRPFERARRDIPVRWVIRSAGGEIQGELEAVGQALEVGDGEGPVLPVQGFFRVEGELRMGGETVPVTGAVRHRQR